MITREKGRSNARLYARGDVTNLIFDLPHALSQIFCQNRLANPSINLTIDFINSTGLGRINHRLMQSNPSCAPLKENRV